MPIFFYEKNVRSFWSAKAFLIFSTKHISVFDYKVVKHLTSWPLTELVKLTMLWTTGPRSIHTLQGSNSIFLFSPLSGESTFEGNNLLLLEQILFSKKEQVISSKTKILLKRGSSSRESNRKSWLHSGSSHLMIHVNIVLQSTDTQSLAWDTA